MDVPVVVLDTRVVTGTGGGPDKTILNSPRFLEGTGYRMLCLYMHPPDDPGFAQIRARAEACEDPLLAVPDGGLRDPGILRRLARICRDERVAIWHAHDYKSNLLGLMLRPFCGFRLVTTVHGWVRHTRRTPLYYAIDRMCLPRYERVVCVSENLHQRCLEIGVRDESCVLIENGIDTARFGRRVPVSVAKQRLGFDPDRPLVGAVGRLSPEKGFDLLIDAAASLLREGKAFDLAIAGEGDQAEALRSRIEALGLSERVRLLGFCGDTLSLFEAMDVFVLSSLREGLPNVLLEAMAAEVPVLATNVAGIPRLIEPGVSGLLVEPGDVNALAAGLARLIDDPALREQLRAEGLRTVRSRFGFDRRMDKIRSLYDELLGTERPCLSPA